MSTIADSNPLTTVAVADMAGQPRELTRDEVRSAFLAYCRGVVKKFSATSHDEHVANGVAHDILLAIDGGANGLPAFLLAPAPELTDKQFCVDIGRNYWPANYQIDGLVNGEISGTLALQFDIGLPKIDGPPTLHVETPAERMARIYIDTQADLDYTYQCMLDLANDLRKTKPWEYVEMDVAEKYADKVRGTVPPGSVTEAMLIDKVAEREYVYWCMQLYHDVLEDKKDTVGSLQFPWQQLAEVSAEGAARKKMHLIQAKEDVACMLE